MQNWNLIGHQWAVDLLKSHLASDRARHAYLITGPRGVGRRTLALRFVQALNAVDAPAPGEFDPAHFASQQFERMQHPDLNVVQTLEGKRDISIEQIRELQRGLILTPVAARYKTALVLNFEGASASAENALLKTLEEPPPSVIMLLTAESSEALLPTTASRCEIIRLRPVRLPEVAEGLQAQFDIDDERADLLAHISGGRPGYAIQLQQDESYLEQRIAWLDEQYDLLQKGRIARFKYAEKLTKDKVAFRQALQVWLSYWRDVLIYTAGSGTPIANLDRSAEIQAIAARVQLQPVRELVSLIEKTAGQLRANVNPRLAAEILLLDFPYL